jgi:ABC-type uncharacterized transport system fused permease/ATPase subunit
MAQSTVTFTPRRSLIGSTALVLAVAFSVSIISSPHAYADECLLDANNDGNADSNVDTTVGLNQMIIQRLWHAVVVLMPLVQVQLLLVVMSRFSQKVLQSAQIQLLTKSLLP